MGRRFWRVCLILCLCLTLAMGANGEGVGGMGGIEIESSHTFYQSNLFKLPKDGEYYAQQYAPMLRSYVLQVRRQSLQKNYPFYSSRPVVEYSVYRGLPQSDKDALRGGILLVGAYISEFIKYSHLGGVGIGGKLKKNDENAFYMSFDGRYLTDLESFGLGKEIFAYCVLPRFDKCIMLGIGEEW